MKHIIHQYKAEIVYVEIDQCFPQYWKAADGREVVPIQRNIQDTGRDGAFEYRLYLVAQSLGQMNTAAPDADKGEFIWPSDCATR